MREIGIAQSVLLLYLLRTGSGLWVGTWGRVCPLPCSPRGPTAHYGEVSLRAHRRSVIFRAGLLGLATLSVITCTADTPPLTGTANQAVVNPPLPSNLNLVLNAKTTVTVGPQTQVNGDVGSVGLSGSVLFDVSSSQGCCSNNVLANTVTVR